MKAAALASVVLALGLSGCGASTPTSSPTKPAVQGPVTVNLTVSGSDFGYEVVAKRTSVDFADFMGEELSTESPECVQRRTIHRFDPGTRLAEGTSGSSCGLSDRFVVWVPEGLDWWTAIESRKHKYVLCRQLRRAHIPVEFYANSLAKGQCRLGKKLVGYEG